MANVDVTKIVQGGQDRVKVVSKEVEDAPSGTVELTNEDIVTYLSDVGSVGATREVQEISLFHMKNKAKMPGSSTIDDVQITEALTKEQVEIRREQYENGKFIIIAFFDAEGNQLYGMLGTITKWGMTLTDGDVCQLTYTISPSDDKIVCTYTDGE